MNTEDHIHAFKSKTIFIHLLCSNDAGAKTGNCYLISFFLSVTYISHYDITCIDTVLQTCILHLHVYKYSCILHLLTHQFL